MNRSGTVLPYLMKYYKLETRQVLIVLDNMDLDPGQCRLKLNGVSSSHNGLKSVLQHVKTDDFMRLYLGIGRPGRNGDVVKYVLGRAGQSEKKIYEEMFGKAAETILKLTEQKPEQVMNELNRKRTVKTD